MCLILFNKRLVPLLSVLAFGLVEERSRGLVEGDRSDIFSFAGFFRPFSAFWFQRRGMIDGRWISQGKPRGFARF